MNREQISREIEEMLGLVPSIFKEMPDASLALEWRLVKQVQLADGAIPNRHRELIGIAISGVTKCRYCAFYHTELAKQTGATDAEIEDAVHYATSSVGWSAYINGLQVDYDTFCDEVRRACQRVRALKEQETEAEPALAGS